MMQHQDFRIDRDALFNQAQAANFPPIQITTHNNASAGFGGLGGWQMLCLIGCECILLEAKRKLGEISEPLKMPHYLLGELQPHAQN